VGVLGHATSLVGVEEHVIDIEGGGHEGLVVGEVHLEKVACRTVEVRHGPKTLINWTNVEVDLDLVVLESNERQSEPRVAAVPELERHVESGLRERVTRSTDLAWGLGVARAIDISE
jgi:hypothetical protein